MTQILIVRALLIEQEMISSNDVSHGLLLEDDIKFGKKIWDSLEAEGFSSPFAESMRNVDNLSEEPLPHLYLLDWLIPTVIPRNEYTVVFFTVRTNSELLIRSLRRPKYDLVNKPYSYEELLFRITTSLNNLMRKGISESYGSVWFAEAQRSAYYKNRKIGLTPSEYRILNLLVQRSGLVVSREEIVKLLGEETSNRTLDSHLSRIRKALREAGCSDLSLHSIYGIGYILEKRLSALKES